MGERYVQYVKFTVMDATNNTRRLYREFRKIGMSRRDANLIVWGVVMANKQGTASTKDLGPWSKWCSDD